MHGVFKRLCINYDKEKIASTRNSKNKSDIKMIPRLKRNKSKNYICSGWF
jgi:hypothetical protein